MLKGCLQFLGFFLYLFVYVPFASLSPSLTDLILCHFPQLGLLRARFYILRHVHPSVYSTRIQLCLWLR